MMMKAQIKRKATIAAYHSFTQTTLTAPPPPTPPPPQTTTKTISHSVNIATPTSFIRVFKAGLKSFQLVVHVHDPL